MKNISKLLIVFSLIFSSCSETTEYELPYELSPASQVSIVVNSTTANVLCPGTIANFTVDSESKVFYVVLPQTETVPSSNYVWEEGEDISFEGANTAEVDLTGLALGTSYTMHAVTVNENGIRSEAVESVSFDTPTFDEVLTSSLASDYTATVSYNGTLVDQFEIIMERDGNSFTAESLWGDFVAWATNVPEYAGLFPYPGTITLDEDFSAIVTSDAGYALGGDGSYDPCTKTFNLTIETNLFDDPETEEVEPLTVTVEIAPTEVESEG